MSLRLNPEYAEASAPFVAMMASAPVRAVHDVEGRREGLKGLMLAMRANAPKFAEISTTEYKFKSYDGTEVSVYYVRKQDHTTPGPAIVHVHGGGMIAGNTIDMATGVQAIVQATGIPTFDVEYRLAPEHPHPTPVEDVYAAITWLHENAAKFNVDKSRICVMGESAGGGIAAGVALMTRDRQLQPPLAKQLLVYPMLDSRNVKPTPGLNELVQVWNVDSNITGWAALLGDKIGSPDVSPYASPAHATNFEGLPQTYIDVGSCDLFRDEDIAYAQALAKANNDVEIHIYPGVPHAFELLAPDITITKQAIANRLTALKGF